MSDPYLPAGVTQAALDRAHDAAGGLPEDSCWRCGRVTVQSDPFEAPLCDECGRELDHEITAEEDEGWDQAW